MNVRALGPALLIACGAAHAGDAATVSAALAGRGDRFVELRSKAGGDRFVNVGPRQVIEYQPSAIVVRSRSSTAALRYELAGARTVAPRGVDASGITYNFLVGPEREWIVGAKSYSRIAYSKPWEGIDAAYVGDTAGIKYHFDVEPGAQPSRIRFLVSGARDARIAADGSIEWQLGGATLRDEPPVAWQPGPGGDAQVPVAFTLERAGEERWNVGFALGKYDPSRALVVDPAWSSFAGLVGGNAADQVYAVARDAAGASYACGATASTNVPATGGTLDTTANGGNDAFVVKFAASGVPQFVTYFGGSGFDSCNAMAVNAADGGIVIAGGTTSLDFPFAGAGDASFRRAKSLGDRDAFVAKITAAGNALAWSGVIGGGGAFDQAHGLALDGAGRAHVVGHTKSGTFPVVGGVLSGTLQGTMDAFALRVNAAGTALEYSGYIGGNGDADVARAVAIGPGGATYVVGEADSKANLPSTPGAFRTDPDAHVSTNGFVARLTSTGALDRFALLVGSSALVLSANDRALGVAVDSDASVVVVGEVDSVNFPMNNSSQQVGTLIAGLRNTITSSSDGFVLRLAPDLSSVIHRGYVGGNRFDSIQAVTADGAGNVFFAGTSAAPGPANPPGSATDLPVVTTPGLRTTRRGLQDGFFGRLNGGTLAYLGFAGSTAHDGLNAVATSPNATLTLGGATTANAAGFLGANTAALGAAPASTNGLVLTVNPFGYMLTDLNGDSRSDVLYRNISTGQVFRLLANGLALSNGAVVHTEPDTQWRIVNDGDFNGDGVSDLVWRSGADGRVYVMPFSASGTPQAGAVVYTEPSSAWRIVATPDLDGDGRADILFWNASSGAVYALLMNGAAIAAQGAVHAEPDTNWRIVAVGDFAGSGKRNQLLWRNQASGQVYLMTVNRAGGAFTTSGQVIYNEPDTAWTIAGAADFNGDGRWDILYRNANSGQVYVLLMNGPAVAASGLVHTEPGAAWKIASYGDYNGDGRADLLWRNDTTGVLYMMLTAPGGLSFQQQGQVYAEPNTAWRVLGPYEYAQ